MQKAILILFLCFFTFPVFSQDYPELRRDDLYKDGFVKSKNFETTVPFEIVEDWIALKPIINGVETTLLFDTHAGLTTLSTEFAKKVKLTKKGQIGVQDAKRELQKTDIYKINFLKIGDLECKNSSCVTTFLPSFMTLVGFEGILGADVINRFNWKINFDSKQITITDKRVEKEANAEEFYFYMNNNVPYVTLKLDEKPYENALIDFGSGGGISFPYNLGSSLNDTISIGEYPARIRLSNGLFGYGEADTCYYLPVENFSIGQVKLPRVKTEVSKKSNLLILGMGVFSQYNIVIDNNNYRYFLTRRREKE
jgi:Aspartyl protease